ncbi:excinuclease ABC subunit UvrA [Verrucomicrobiota bacterium sgz303538]
MQRPALTIVPDPGVIEIRGARQNNLKGFDLDLPLGKLIVVSGPSGCGKSSLAFDTVYAEGQRRYVETFSPYTRQFFERMDKPKVDAIRGIPPAIAIEQANPVKTTRSTVGTITEINEYLKLLLPRVVTAYCPNCQKEVRPESAASIVDHVLADHAGETLLVTFGVPVPAGTTAADFFGFLQQQGFLRVWISGEVIRVDEPEKAAWLPGVVQVIQDRIQVTPENRSRFCEAVESALRFGKGKIAFARSGANSGSQLLPYSTGWHCAHCDQDIVPPSAGLFSFNHPQGACPRCRGFGRTIAIDLDRAIPNRRLSIAEGAIKPFQTENGQECQRDLLRAASKRNFDIDCPFDELPKADQQWVLYGEKTGAAGEELWKNNLWYGVKGFFDWLESKTYKMHVRVLLARYRNYTICPDCQGGRFQPTTLNFRFAGKTLPELAALPVDELLKALERELAKVGSDSTAEMLLGEITSRLRYLAEVGLSYLTLDRPTKTLSGGELERVNLTTCLGASLVNTLFVLDEPSVGLHPRDTGRLIRVMQQLRDKGNTLLVVEHEEAVIRAADHLVELGPGRGEAGGSLVYNGPLKDLLAPRSAAPKGKNKNGKSPKAALANAINTEADTLTRDYLTGTKSIPVPSHRRAPNGWITVRNAREHNLRGVDVEFPLGVFACVTGVSGSGKSTLVHDVLYRGVLDARGMTQEEAPGSCDEIVGAGNVGEVIMVDQSPLSRTPRSSPAVYLGVFDSIRELFAGTEHALTQGLTASAFSFNSGTGRCERCCGAGWEKIEMQFLSDVFVRCPECEGRRYQAHVLEVKLAGKSIHDVLELTVTEAIRFFDDLGTEKVSRPLRVLEDVGLGYLTLGQPLNVLSGGESQRLKLVERLTKRTETGALLILDEPTTGLHFDDVAMLVKVFDRLVEQGNSLLVIEHNIEVIKSADYIVDLGPEAGVGGGLVVAKGTPEEVAGVEESHTGRFLRIALRPDAHHFEDSEPSALVAEVAPSYGRQSPTSIQVRGAREHNLKNISLDIPREKMVVVTGLSGSGKSTLAFDLLFAEGQRRFLDSMSAYARQFVEQLERPEVDAIVGLPPTVAIEQRITRGGGKSTVATVTEVYHFLRLLWAKLGTQFCPKCQVPVEKQTLAAAVKKADSLTKSGRIRILAPLVKARKGFHTDVARWALRHGYEQLLVDGKWERADQFPKLERFREHTIDVLVGERGSSGRTQELLKRALEIGRGTARLIDAKGRSHVVSTERCCPDCGQSFEELDPRLFSFNSPHGWCPECRGFGEVWKAWVNPRLDSELEIEMDQEKQHEWLDEGQAKTCPSCDGSRLNSVARAVQLRGQTLDQVVAMSAKDALAWADKLKFKATEGIIAADIVPEIAQRLRFMGNVGLDYLSLDRSAKTLSGGESQRIRLAAQLGSNLRGVLYVLDEPTIGLHPRDNDQLLDTLEALKGKGNSLVIVEHDDETMRRADHIIDLGPGAGSEGGQVVAQGTLTEICETPGSSTGRCLREPLQHPIRGARRPLNEVENWIELSGARLHNLKDVDVRFPVGRLTVITGISGSGKSTLMRGVLKPTVEQALAKKKSRKTKEQAQPSKRAANGKAKPKAVQAAPASFRGSKDDSFNELTGFEHLEAIYEVDQSPIGKTSRSTPATYIKVFDDVRALFAQMPLSRMRGYTASRFSFNTEGGRCETCTGQGVIKVEMNFLPTSYLPCPDCHGKRYNPATLEVLYNERSIGDVMEMTLAQASEFFRALPKIHRPLQLLCDTGLGYLKLGQASPTLSGGEAQRLKLVAELIRGVGRTENERLRRGSKGKSILYLLEEPTIGLHLCDVQRLLDVLHRLVDDGHTVVVIEHHLSLIAEADYLIDIGPEAGTAGGELVASGTPEEVSKSKKSRISPFLREVLGTAKGNGEPKDKPSPTKRKRAQLAAV